MRKILALAGCLLVIISIQAQNGNVGIGTQDPKARLHVADSAVVFTGRTHADSVDASTFPPVTGNGIRMMWLPSRAAFRAGAVTGTAWDRDSIGYYSAAFGYNSQARYNSSFAANYLTRATHLATTAFGFNTHAMAPYTTAFGYSTIAKSNSSFTIGVFNDTSEAFQEWSWMGTDRLFQIGNGFGEGFRTNALTVLRNGRIGIGTVTPAAITEIKGFSNFNFPHLMISSTAHNQYSKIRFGHPGTIDFFDIAAIRDTVTNGAKHLNFYSSTWGDVLSLQADGRIGIGITNPDSAAALHFNTWNRGIVLPWGYINSTRDYNTIKSNGPILFFQTGGAGSADSFMTAGLYYRYYGEWQKLGTASESWSINGNRNGGIFGTVDSTNINFRLKNQYAGKLTANGNIFLGYNAGINSISNTSNIGMGIGALRTTLGGSRNIALGDSVLYAANSSTDNIAIGYRASRFSTSSTRNISIGNNSHQNMLSSFDNIGIGYLAGSNISNGDRNVFIGNYAGEGIATGNQNIAIGFNANFLFDSLTNAIAIGYNSQANCNNCAVIGQATVSGVLDRMKLGISIQNPAYPITLPGIYGDKISFYGNASNHYGIGVQPNLLQIHTQSVADDIIFGSGNSGAMTERFRMTGDGFFGIGQASPSYPLNFASTFGNKISLYGNSTDFYGFAVQFGQMQMFSDAITSDVTIGAKSAGVFTERMRIKGNGNVGIGQTAPGFPLNFANALGDKISLYGNAGVHYGFGIQNSLLQIHTDGSGADIAFGFGSSGAFSETVRIKNSGVISFQPWLGKKLTLYPGATGDVGMAVQGNQFQIYADNPNASVRLGIDQGGVFQYNLDVFANGNATLRGTLTQLSDASLKEQIIPLQESLQKIKRLNGYTYYWKKKEDEDRQIGVLAHEVQKYFPELVKKTEDGNLSVNYSGLIPVVIEAVKEQQSQIEKQQQEIDELRKIVKELQGKMK